tara:strand:+ start:21369 stop:22556 length:1188 start_codon:yes stop_codon:yes gene_type:complete
MSKIEFLDLGMQPIANNFLSSVSDIKNEYKFRLAVTFDDDTKLVSLSNFVSPDLMFNDSYVYHSSLSKTMRSHFKDAALSFLKDYSPEKVLEIGSNDGVFLKNFSSKRSTAIGVEPCSNFANITRDLGYATYDKFWNNQLAKEIVLNHGKQDLIFSANCICHIQNLDEAFSAISKTMSSTGIFVFEDPSLLSMINRRSYDQIYDEHAHIFSIIALRNLLDKHDLSIFKVQSLKVHGGSNRIFVCHKGVRSIEESVSEIISKEIDAGLNTIDAYRRFAYDVEKSKRQLLDIIHELKRKNYKIISYGATSKSTTVFNYCGIGTNLIDYIVDTTPAKHGKLSPGAHIPVISPEEGFNDTVDYAFLGAWNYENEICEKERKFLKKNRFITHVPYVRFIK